MRTLMALALVGMLAAASLAADGENAATQSRTSFTPGAAGSPVPATVSQTSIRPNSDFTPGGGLAGLLNRSGLFDSNRLKTWRSYSFGVTSGGGHTSSAGLFLQHMEYQFSQPLKLYMEVGLLHDPLGMAGVSKSNGPQQAELVIPAMDLIYQPTENLYFQIHYSQGRNSAVNPWLTDRFGETW